MSTDGTSYSTAAPTTARRGRFRGLATVGLAMALVAALSGCGNKLEQASSSTTAAPTTTEGGSDTSEQTTTTEGGGLSGTNTGLGSKLGDEVGSLPGLGTGGSDSATDDAFGPEVETCLDNEASDMSSDDVDIVTSNGDFSELSPEGTQILTDAMNTCIPSDALGQLFADEFAAELGSEPDPEFTSCLSTELDGKTGDVVVEAAAASESGGDEMPQALLDVLDACGESILSDFFVAELAKEGIPEQTAQCIADGLGGKLSMSDLIELGQGGDIPSDVQADIESLAQSCASGG
ncbi:MAG: hypothetical protein R2754_08635 [Microthrixaceae bacterium]